MEIWLVQNGDRLMLPVTPVFMPERSMNNEQINLNEVGTVNLAGNKGLMTVTLESFFPAQDYYFNENKANLNPYYYVEKIEKWQLSKKPVRLIITDTPYNFEVLIDKFSAGEPDGTGDVHYTIETSEYIRLETHKNVENTKVVSFDDVKKIVGTVAETTALLTVGKYDTPWTMAKKILGNGERFKELIQKNGEITPGKVLKT